MKRVLVAVAPVDPAGLIDPAALDPWRALLDPIEKAAADRFIRAEDRASYQMAHGLRRGLCRVLLGRQDVTFAAQAPQGKPQVVGLSPGLDVSISHTSGAVACILGLGCKVGVDLERIDRPFGDDVGRHVFTPSERAWIDADATRRSLTLWTLKEAISKAVGLGLSLGFSDLALQPDPWQIARAPEPCGDRTEWILDVWQATAQHVAALAVQGRGALLPGAIVARAADVLPPGVVFRTLT